MSLEAVLALDPGPEQSAYVIWDGERVLDHGKRPNHGLLDIEVPKWRVIEKIAAMGMAVGETTFETVFWSGRFAQAWGGADRITRYQVKLHVCRNARAKDANIRQAVIDRVGEASKVEFYRGPKGGLKRRVIPGPTYGLVADEWQALALALTWWDQKFPQPRAGAISVEEVPF